MKKSKLLLKSLIGVPVGIFVLELFNICLSLGCGEYIRVDAIDTKISLNNVLTAYAYCSITSYLLMVYLNYAKYVLNLGLPKNEERKANKKIYPVLMVTFLITFFASYIGNIGDIVGVLASFVWSGIVIIVVSIETLLNKYFIKQINEKLKEISKNKL